MIDYEILRLLWWAVLGVLLIGIAVMDGFDYGAAILLPFVGKTDAERRLVINTVGPVWEGNQVWLILGAGAIFAAWPQLYAVAFSGFYLAMLLLLASLILRPVGFKFRGKVESAGWRTVWDLALFVGGLVPALVYGVAFGNALQGVPFRIDDTMRMFYEGTVWGLFNPFGLLAGLLSVAMITLHGGTWLACKTTGPVKARAAKAAVGAGIVAVVLFAIGGFWVGHIDFYALSGTIDPNGPSNPLAKHVVMAAGGLLTNYGRFPLAMLAPVVGFAGLIGALLLARGGRRPKLAFVLSSLGIAGIIATAGISAFPFLLPSSIAPGASMMVWDSSSSFITLAVMTGVTVVFLPIILIYTGWVYRVLRGPLSVEEIGKDSKAFY